MNLIAVDVRDVSFKYHKSKVLQDVCMVVPKNCIYALLGPSGSGKTTLLRLMLGRIKPDSGSIAIFGSKPGLFNRIIGYMPQNQALSPELTVEETMNYFASIYQLQRQRYHKTKSDLKQILCLADDHQVVSTLSGGQQKALSLALVFLHSPKLVILDEPTVGTDPVLGDQIWNYLRNNCDEGLTVIIVTHYIQEASLADHVGMMRNGRLIEHGTPNMLYDKYSEVSLETIFIKICTDKKLLSQEVNYQIQSYQQNIAKLLTYDAGNDLVYKNSAQVELEKSHTSLSEYSLLWLLFILIRRNIYKFLNSKMTSIMLFSPMFCTLLMCLIFKVDRINLPTAVYNEDHEHTYSNQFQIRVNNFSNHFIAYSQCDSLDEAISRVERGHAIAAIWFQQNFSSAIIKRSLASIEDNSNNDQLERENLENSIASLLEPPKTLSTTLDDISIIAYDSNNSLVPLNLTKNATTNQDLSRSKRQYEEYEEEEEESLQEEVMLNETLRASTIKVFIDNSNIFYSQPLADMLNYGSWELVSEVAKDQGRVTLTSPVRIAEVIYAEGTTAPDFLLSGYMIGFLYLSQVTLASQLLIVERNDGFFDRAIVAGAKHSLMFFSHFITNLILSLLQIGLMFLIGFTWYQIPNFGSYWLTFTLVVLQSASSITTGLLISAICKENFSAFFIALSITLSQLFTSGAIFPIISFDPIIKFFLNVTPISMPVESLRNVMLRGWTLRHYHVLHGFLTNIATTMLFGSLALIFFIRRS